MFIFALVHLYILKSTFLPLEWSFRKEYYKNKHVS